MLPPVRLVSEAAELAARRHSGMARKGRGNEPYINHLAEVANLLSAATDGADAELVAAGWLHDSIEDTETTRKELAQKFSERVASLVVECTDDMSLPKVERRRLQVVNASHKSPGAAIIKFSDKLYNLRDLTEQPPADWERARVDSYFQWAEEVIENLLPSRQIALDLLGDLALAAAAIFDQKVERRYGHHHGEKRRYRDQEEIEQVIFEGEVRRLLREEWNLNQEWVHIKP